MDQKGWLWKKISSPKTTLLANKVVSPLRRFEGETLYAPTKKEEVGSKISEKNLSEKLASVLLNCQDIDDCLIKPTSIEQEAVAVSDKDEEESAGLKKELDEAEQEKRITEAVMEKSREYEKTQKKLEDDLKETSKKVANLAVENTHLSKALLAKEKLIEEFQKRKSQADAEFNVLMARLDSTEKENAFIKYEFRMLEKELEIRNEESEYNRRSADASRKQHLESVKKIAMLEEECQRLYLLMEKRLPRGRKQNPSRDLIIRATTADNFMIKQLRDMEEENKALKEIITKNTTDLHSSRIMNVRAASRLSEMENKLRQFSNDRKVMELASDDGVSSSGSWAPESANLRNGRLNYTPERKALNDSDMSLMDDFVEMEKLAIVAVDTPSKDHEYYNLKKAFVETVKPFDWLQVVLQAMSEQKRISNRSLEELLGDIKIALGYIDHPSPIGQHVQSKSNLSKSIRKIIKLIAGINSAFLDNNDFPDNSSLSNQKSKSLRSEAAGDYIVRVFQWKNSEVSAVLNRFIRTCNNLQNGKADFEEFSEELAFALDWVLKNYATSRDASSARGKIKKHFGWNESPSEMEESNDRLEDEMKITGSAEIDAATDKMKSLTIQLQESEKTIGILRAELESLKESKEIIEDEIENQKTINEELDTQLTVAKAKLNEVLQKVSSLEVELEDRSNCCEELEATCLELQLQLESIVKKESPINCIIQDEKQSRNGWEITTASARLAECQETIISLGKQLKALASPREAALFDKVLSTTNHKNMIKRSSLRDRMLAEDDAKSLILMSPKPKEADIVAESQKPNLLSGGTVAVVGSKKHGGLSLLRKLLMRRKKWSSKKSRLLAKV